jgi:phage repressor protein C with HTH and peptisase S24 domain
VRWPLFRVAVAERSMQPAVEPGDWLVVLRTTRAKPGQLVISVNPEKPGMLLVKRLGRCLPDGTYWLESDNPAAGAVDSRSFGPVTAIAGRVLFRYHRAHHRAPQPPAT